MSLYYYCSFCERIPTKEQSASNRSMLEVISIAVYMLYDSKSNNEAREAESLVSKAIKCNDICLACNYTKSCNYLKKKLEMIQQFSNIKGKKISAHFQQKIDTYLLNVKYNIT